MYIQRQFSSALYALYQWNILWWDAFKPNMYKNQENYEALFLLFFFLIQTLYNNEKEWSILNTLACYLLIIYIE